jgi:hypothetical protein
MGVAVAPAPVTPARLASTPAMVLRACPRRSTMVCHPPVAPDGPERGAHRQALRLEAARLEDRLSSNVKIALEEVDRATGHHTD